MIIPRDYQDIAVKSVFDFFRQFPNNRHPVVAMPTGTGKSVVIATFLQRAFAWYANQKVVVATHVKELVGQNYKKFVELWPTAPVGVYSAGLKRKDLHARITFAGVASIVKNIEKFGKIDLFLIDECHLLSPEEESMYMKCINLLWVINPHMKVIGFTATYWREGIGDITQGGTLFTDICINMCDMVSFNWFIKQGYLLPLIPKSTSTVLDVDGVRMTGGDFNGKQLELAVNKDQITFAALQEAIAIAREQGRKHWLVFGAGLQHCAKIYEMLTYLGVTCRVVHSKMSEGERDKNIADFLNQEYEAIINNGILTTGFDDPNIDMIIMLRPTASSKLWVQMLGRGTRPVYVPGFDLTTLEGRLASIEASSKQNCLVLDFAKNSKRLGPINDPVIPKKKGEGKGEVPIKICDACGMYNHISARFCGGAPYRTNEGCGSEFHFKVAITEEASTAPLIKDELPVIETFRVTDVHYAPHITKQGHNCVKVTYYCGAKRYPEFILFETPGFGQRRAKLWWQDRSAIPCPSTSAEALKIIQNFDPPMFIRVRTDTKYPEIKAVDFTGAFAAPVTTDDIPF